MTRRSRRTSKEPSVTVRTFDSNYSVTNQKEFEDTSKRWSATLRNRGAWSHLFGLRERLAEESRHDLEQLCPKLKSDQAFEHLASAGLIEIHFNESSDAAAWDIPWEFLLSSATEKNRPHAPLLVNRHLACKAKSRTVRSEPRNLLVCKNNPDYLGRLYTDKSLQREEENLAAHLGLPLLPAIHNKPLESIRKRIAKDSPHVIHIAGIDSLQAARPGVCPKGLTLTFPNEEALVIADAKGAVRAATGSQLAPIVCAGRSKPFLVGLNFVNSGSRIAPNLVRHGAAAALGFLNDFDDIAAETFFANFYLAWRLSDWNLLDAFRMAWSKLPSPNPRQMWGSGVALWSRDSLLDSEKARRNAAGIGSSLAEPPDSLRRSFEAEREKPIPKEQRRNIRVFASQFRNLNYSLLHNDRDLFEYFYVRKPQCVGTLSGLNIDVALHAGAEPMTYHTSGELNDSVWVLHNQVRVPLTSTLARSVREIIHTRLSVKVEWNGGSLFDKNFPVSLMPIDQWQNDDANRKWLPSFVLPRDPAVARIIDTAQSYLTALADEAGAGFDGYQSSSSEAVNVQVRAVWWALINNLPVSYINPLPVYTTAGQRLRSPSAVLSGRRGTCLDLALLLAACLEYLDLYPALFLLREHAFVGYYANSGVHEDVCKWAAENIGPDGDPWVLGTNFYDKLKEYIESEAIIPIEATWLTKKFGVRAAIREAKEKLDNKELFDWFIDIKLARDSAVTPLPLVETE